MGLGGIGTGTVALFNTVYSNMSAGVWTRAAAACGVASGTFTLGFYGTERAFKEYDRRFPDLEDDDDEEDVGPRMTKFGSIRTVGSAQPLENSGFKLAKSGHGGCSREENVPSPALKVPRICEANVGRPRSS